LNATAWLAGAGAGAPPPPPPGNCASPGQKLGNPGFETGTAAPWTATAGVVTNSAGEPAHAGTWKAWLDGYGVAHTDTLRQAVTVPAGCTSATLSFWLHVDTAETSTTTAFDTLTVAAGGSTVATFSNLDHSTGYALRSVAVPATAGSLTVSFTGVEGTKLQTSFVVDDVALTVA
jgi:hypothetical protein